MSGIVDEIGSRSGVIGAMSGIGQLVGVGVGGNSGGTDTNEVTIDVNKNYVMWILAWNHGSNYVHMEVFTAVGNGSSHTFTQNQNMTGSIGVAVGSSGGNGTCQGFTDSPFGHCQMFVFEQGRGFDIS